MQLGHHGSAPGEAPKLWVGLPFNKMPAHPGNGWMAAFSASSRKAVDEAYAAAISVVLRTKAPQGDSDKPGLQEHEANRQTFAQGMPAYAAYLG